MSKFTYKNPAIEYPDYGSEKLIIKQDITSWWSFNLESQYKDDHFQDLYIVFNDEIDMEPLENGTVICKNCNHQWDREEFEYIIKWKYRKELNNE